MKNFNRVTKALTKKNIPCNVKLDSRGEITIECGWDYPDRFFHEVYSVTQKLGVEVCICADSGSSMTTNVERIAGGPNNW